MRKRRYSYQNEIDFYGWMIRHHRGTQASAVDLAGLQLRSFLGPLVAMFNDKLVLEIGAGGCFYARYIAKVLSPASIFAVDIFLPHLRLARGDDADEALHLVVGDCFHLPFASGAFDIVFGSLVLSHIPELWDVAGEIRRVLRPGGRYVGVEPNPLNPFHLFRYFFRPALSSPNLYLLRQKHLSHFKKLGFDVSVRSFYRKLPNIQTKYFGSCMGILAQIK